VGGRGVSGRGHEGQSPSKQGVQAVGDKSRFTTGLLSKQRAPARPSAPGAHQQPAQRLLSAGDLDVGVLVAQITHLRG